MTDLVAYAEPAESFLAGRAKHLYIVCVLGHESLEVARVVRVELPLHRVDGVHA